MEVRFEVEGESVAGQLHDPPGDARGQLVLVHGLLSCAAEYAEAPARLAERGWRVLAVDQRGFGASGGPRGVISEARATADTLAAVAWMRASRPELPIGVIGHSMGAVFVLGAMMKDNDIRAGILAAPMNTVRAELKDAEFLGYRVAHALSRAKEMVGFGPLRVPYKNRYADLFHDPESARRAEAVGFLASEVSLGNYDALIAMDSSQNARKVKQPVLVLLAEHDKAVKPDSSRTVYHALAGPKELVTLRCGHSMFGDHQAEVAIEQVDRWMSKHLG